MINPRFTGRIGEDLTYTLTAQRAQRDLERQAPITLNDPVYTEENGRIVLAPDGAYDPAAGRIDLQGGVTFTDGGGNRFTSRAAVVDLENKVLRGDMEIVGEGPLGVVRADAYELHSLDNKIVFRGRVRGVMPERGRALPTRNETQPRATAAGGGETGG
jgi:lipopolysaccharide export system protein LptC